MVPNLAVAQPSDVIALEPTPIFADFSTLVREPLPASVRCNCYQFVKTKLPDLPPTQTILFNIKKEGQVAVFYYPESNLHHYAYLIETNDKGYLIEETNYFSCQHSYRFIPRGDPSLLGFY